MSVRRPHSLVALAAAALAGTAALPAHAAKDVVVAIQYNLTTTDPYDANDTLSQAVAKSFYQGLFDFDKELNIAPVLASGYTVSKDGLTYTVKLRSGIKFQDGTDFNAAAVKANFDRVTNPDNRLKRYSLYKNIASTEAVDEATVRFTLKEAFSPFISTLAHPSAAIISPAALAKYGKDIGRNPVGTGPFKLAEWKATDYLKVAKWDGYWKPGFPKVDSITWRPVVDNNTRAAMMQTNEAHFAYPLPPESVAALRAKPSLEVVASASIVQRYMSMNVQHKPFDNPKVRQAINYAINRDALVKVAFNGFATPADGIVPQGVQYAAKQTPWPYNPGIARELLKQAGYPNGFESTLWSAFNDTTSQKAIQFIQQQLAQVGIKLQVQALESGQRVERVENAPDPATAPVRLFYVGWSSSTGEADWALRPLLASESFPPKQFNTAYYKNAEVDSAIAKALATTNPTEKAKLYADAQQRVWKDAPWAPLVTLKLISVRARNLSGFYVMPDQSFNFDNVDLK